jgi:hypothetical protein
VYCGTGAENGSVAADEDVEPNWVLRLIEEGGVGEEGVVDHLADFGWELEDGNHCAGRGDGL